MTLQDILDRLRRYEEELRDMLERFTRTKNGVDIGAGDSSRFEQIVVELRDLYDDSLGRNSYSSMTVNAFNEGIDNFTRSPSYRSVERVKGIVSSVVTRLERNPDLLVSKDQHLHSATTTQVPLEVPEKVTLRWLFNHVPYTYWLGLTGMLIFSFSLGVAATAKLSIVQEWIGVNVETVVNQDTGR